MELIDVYHDPIKGIAQIVVSLNTHPSHVDETNEPLLITRRWEVMGSKLLGENDIPPYKLIEVRAGMHGYESVYNVRYRQEYQLSFESKGDF